ncbi:ABC transporter substrate-binding protein [Paenibacillus sp. HJGM_3]|uniref:ABC transporter substrate-binding protein n=1 Tax=Paenibacillus sp. HJGM_3 TaxID=3379816 RepID=UPI0038594B79
MIGKWKSKMSLGMAGMMTLSMMLAACSGGGGNTGSTTSPSSSATPTPIPAKKEEPVTLRIVHQNSPDQDAHYKRFMEKYPNITVIVEKATGGQDANYMEKIAALNAAGTPADLTWVVDITAYMKDGLVEDLTPLMANNETMKKVKFPEGLLDMFKIKGKQYALPRSVNPIFIYVNKDMLAKYGMEMPKNDWTWTQFREMAKKATDPKAGDWGIGDNAFTGIYGASALAMANGHADNLFYLNKDMTQSVLNTPDALADFRWWQELQSKDHSLPNYEESKATGFNRAMDGTFITGKVLFNVGGSWVGKTTKDNAKFNWDILPFPKGTVKQVGVNSTGQVAILSGSKNKEAAMKLLAFQFEKEEELANIKDSFFPVTVDPDLNKAIAETDVWKGKNVTASTLPCCTRPGPNIPAWNDYYAAWNGYINDALFNGKDINTTVIPNIEAWNKKTLDLRKQLGL